MSFLFDPAEAMKSGVYVSGTTGTGKSDLGMYVADELMKLGVTVIVFDPSQDWQTRSSIPYYQTLQNIYVDTPKQSIIYDLSGLSILGLQALIEAFCKSLMREQARTPKPERQQYFLIFEEAHTYFPEGCMRAKRYQNTVRMMTQGRNFDVRFMCITQFSSLIDKNAMRYMRQRYFGASDEPNDVDYIRRMIRDNASELRRLQPGEFLYTHKGKTVLTQIKPYKNKHKPKLIAASEPQPMEPIKPKPKQDSSTVKAILNIIMWLFWAWMILMALAHRP